MPIISIIGRKVPKVKGLIALLYITLTIGAVTMVYPFLLMIAISITSGVDSDEFRLIPKYLFDKKALFTKYVEEKYIRINELNNAYGTDYIGFKEITPPEIGLKEKNKLLSLVPDWNDFKSTLPSQYRLLYFEKEVEKIYQKFLKNKYQNKISALNKEYIEENEDFSQVQSPFEDLLYPEWKQEETKKMSEWYEFKSELSPLYIKPVAGDPYYQKYLKKKYEKIEDLNKRWETDYLSFSQVHLPQSAPFHIVQSADWAEFITTQWPDRYKRARNGKDPKPSNGGKTYSLRDIEIKSSENLYQEYLKNKYKDINIVNEKYGTDWINFSSIIPPYKIIDWVEMLGKHRKIRWHFVTKNYREVINYMAVQERSIFNTGILCAAMIITTLTINPLCAYVLSRFNLASTFKILLFLLATMAFPAEVTMIPGFLLLKQFHMLNTYWALILPGIASGFSIFLLKGFFDSLPEELFESAIMDGASEFRMFWQIAIPLSKPIFAVLALGAFGSAYGSFMWAFIVCQNPKMWTLMVHLYQLQMWAPKYVLMAALTIASIPTLFVFIFCQKIIMRGIILPMYK